MPVRLPTRRRVIINILEDEIRDVVTSLDTPRRRNIESIMQAINNAATVEDDLSDEDWNELENIRARTNEDMARQVDYGYTLVTDNTSDFERIDELKIINWKS